MWVLQYYQYFIESVVYIPWEWLNIPTLQLCILKHSLRWVKLWTFVFFPKDLLYSFWILDINLLILFLLSIWFKKPFLLLIHWPYFFFKVSTPSSSHNYKQYNKNVLIDLKNALNFCIKQVQGKCLMQWEHNLFKK